MICFRLIPDSCRDTCLTWIHFQLCNANYTSVQTIETVPRCYFTRRTATEGAKRTRKPEWVYAHRGERIPPSPPLLLSFHPFTPSGFTARASPRVLLGALQSDDLPLFYDADCVPGSLREAVRLAASDYRVALLARSGLINSRLLKKECVCLADAFLSAVD